MKTPLPIYSIGLVLAVSLPFIATASLFHVFESTDLAQRGAVLVEVYSPNFLEQESCIYGAMGNRLSVNPLTRNNARPLPSTQAEARSVVHIRNLQCMAYAMNEVEAYISTMPAGPRRSRAESLFSEAKAWWRGGVQFYLHTVGFVLNANPEPRFRLGYPLREDNYAMGYSYNAMLRLYSITTENKVLDAQHFSKPVLDFLSSIPLIPGLPPLPGSMALATGQTFFTSAPSADATKTLLEFDLFHREASVELLCKMKTGTWCKRPAAAAAADMKAKETEAHTKYHMPLIPEFAGGVYGGYTYDQLCNVSQRIEHAHHAWVDGVIRGNTPEGFMDAWFAGLAHAVLHIERRTGYPLLNRSMLVGDRAIAPAIMDFLDYSVPGVGSDGVCHLDFEDHKGGSGDPGGGTLVAETTLLPDTFTRANGAIGNGWNVVSGSFRITGNEARSRESSKSVAVLPQVSGANMFVRTDFGSVDNENAKFGVILRYQDPKNYYVVYRQTGGTSQVIIAKVVNGTLAVLKSAKITNPSYSKYFFVEGTVTGSTITASSDAFDRKVTLSVTDTTFAQGTPGLLVESRSSQKADNFDAKIH